MLNFLWSKKNDSSFFSFFFLNFFCGLSLGYQPTQNFFAFKHSFGLVEGGPLNPHKKHTQKNGSPQMPPSSFRGGGGGRRRVEEEEEEEDEENGSGAPLLAEETEEEEEEDACEE